MADNTFDAPYAIKPEVLRGVSVKKNMILATLPVKILIQNIYILVKTSEKICVNLCPSVVKCWG
jgi:hypothetical protein